MMRPVPRQTGMPRQGGVSGPLYMTPRAPQQPGQQTVVPQPYRGPSPLQGTPQRMYSGPAGGQPRLTQFMAPPGVVMYRSNDPSPVPTETASVPPMVVRQRFEALPASAVDHTLPRPEPAAKEPAVAKAEAPKAVLQEPLLGSDKEKDLEAAENLDEEECKEEAEESPLVAWARPLLLLTAGIVVWIWPEKIFAVLFFFAALLCTPHLGAALRRGLRLPRLGLFGWLATFIVDLAAGLGTALWERSDRWKPKLDEALDPESDFAKSVSRYVMKVAGNVGSSLLKEKSHWLPPMVDAVGEVVPPTLSRVMRKKADWSPDLVDLVNDVVPKVLNHVFRNKQWTPAVFEFIETITPVIIQIVLTRPEMVQGLPRFMDAAGPNLAPAVVRLVERVIQDPQMMRTVKKITDSSIKDDEMIRRIKGVIEENLQDGGMYRAVGKGVMNAAEQSMEDMKTKAARAVGLR